MTMTITRDTPLAWMGRAACRGMSRKIFFPDEFELPDEKALATCRLCDVKRECLAWAIDHDEAGIWGGLTEEERRKITTVRSRVKCPDCYSELVREEVGCEVCLSCGLSWPI